jgi:NADH dehydrogenase
MSSRLEAADLATVFGGSGFVGRHTIRALAGDGWRIRAAMRRPDLAGHLQPMGAVGQIHAVQANLRYPTSVEAAVQGARVVINLVGLLHKSGPQTFEKVHVEGSRSVARAAWKAGSKTLIHISAIGTDPKAPGHYGRTKAAGEAAVREEFPGAIILRPSIVFGPEDQFFNRFAGLAQSAPMLPLVGGGRTRFQPVYVGDLARAIAAVAAGAGKPGTVYEIGGPEVATFRQLLDRTQAWAGRSKPYAPLPFALAKLVALSTVPLPNAIRPLTVDQVRMLTRDNVVSATAIAEGRTLAGLGIDDPATMASIVPTYLERFRPKGQFAHYRG